jgi:hypothetical protein
MPTVRRKFLEKRLSHHIDLEIWNGACGRSWLATNTPLILAPHRQIFGRELIERSIRGSIRNPQHAAMTV